MVYVSAVQMRISDYSTETNLLKTLSYIDSAAGSDILCFPEVNLTGELKPDFDEINNFLREVGQKVKQHKMWAIVGAYVRRQEQTFNELYTLNRSGKVVSTYKKMYPWKTETGVIPGPREQVPVVETDFGRIGVLNCYDITFTDPVRRVVDAGAEILFFPANWFGVPREDNPHYAGFPSARSYEFLVPVVFCDMCRNDTTSRSQIVVPEKILAEAKGEEIISVNLDLSKRAKWKEKFPCH